MIANPCRIHDHPLYLSTPTRSRLNFLHGICDPLLWQHNPPRRELQISLVFSRGHIPTPPYPNVTGISLPFCSPILNFLETVFLDRGPYWRSDYGPHKSCSTYHREDYQAGKSLCSLGLLHLAFWRIHSSSCRGVVA
jgi:hypothetical protein